MEPQAKVVQLKTQLVKEGHTRNMLAETNLMTLRIHCYAPGIGENALHSHTKEDHIFLVLQGTAQFNTGRDGKTVANANKNQPSFCPQVVTISSAIRALNRWLWRVSARGSTKRTNGSTRTAQRYRVGRTNRARRNRC